MQIHPESKGFQRRGVKKPNIRYFVPDLSPQDRDSLKRLKPRWIFVAESPHVTEIEPERVDERRPLCGMAGRKWWNLLSELLEGEKNDDVSLKRVTRFCLEHRLSVMNAVQYPMDPKVASKIPGADPVQNLGFNKVSGLYSFKKLRTTVPVQNAISSLRSRLMHPVLKGVPIYCLGNDADWFVKQALLESEDELRVSEKIPHPSAWWRKGGYYGKVAREKLQKAIVQQS